MAKKGDKFFHPTFGGGVTIEVLAVLRHKTFGPAVRVRLTPAPLNKPVRTWKVDSYYKTKHEAEAALTTRTKP